MADFRADHVVLPGRESGDLGVSDTCFVPVSTFLSGKLEDDDFSRLSDALGAVQDKSVYLADTPTDWQYVAKHGRRFAEAHADLRLIALDNIHSFLRLLPKRHPEDELVKALQGLKRLARQRSIPVVATLLMPSMGEANEAATYHWPSAKDKLLGVADVVLEINKAQGEVTSAILRKMVAN